MAGDFDSARVHITVKPTAVGELDYTAMVCNVNDASNAFLLNIRGFVTETQQKDVLRINATHDFGDCYEGWYVGGGRKIPCMRALDRDTWRVQAVYWCQYTYTDVGITQTKNLFMYPFQTLAAKNG